MKQNKTNKFSLIYVIMAILLIVGVFSVLFIPKDNNDNSSGGAVDFSQMTYVSFGDSITYGVDGQTTLRMENPYPSLVADEMGFKNFYNYAVSGSTISYVSGLTNVNSQLTNATSKADIVSVMIGVNDFAKSCELGTIDDKGLTTIYGGLNTLVKGLKSKYNNAYIFFMTPFQQWRFDDPNSVGVSLIDVVNAIKQVCENNDIPVLDMYNLCNFNETTDPYCDGLHPTQQFMTNYVAPMVSQFIKDNYKK